MSLDLKTRISILLTNIFEFYCDNCVGLRGCSLKELAEDLGMEFDDCPDESKLAEKIAELLVEKLK